MTTEARETTIKKIEACGYPVTLVHYSNAEFGTGVFVRVGPHPVTGKGFDARVVDLPGNLAAHLEELSDRIAKEP